MWPNPQETADLVTFIEEILNGKLHFLFRASYSLGDLDSFQSSVTFHIVYSANQMTGFYMKYKTGLVWFNICKNLTVKYNIAPKNTNVNKIGKKERSTGVCNNNNKK